MKVALVSGSSPLPDAANWSPLPRQSNVYGKHSGPLRAVTDTGAVVYLPRHDEQAHLAPHAINYRANVDALVAQGVTHALCSYSVGGVDAALAPGTLVVPDQLIDYTWGRAHTFYDGAQVQHIEFSAPFDADLRTALLAAGVEQQQTLVTSGIYGVTQGPRLETNAEIARLARDGCTLVGMTAMPEVALLRERGIAATALCLVVNPAAGVVPGAVDFAAMQAVSQAGAAAMQSLLLAAAQRLVSA